MLSDDARAKIERIAMIVNHRAYVAEGCEQLVLYLN